MDCISYFERSNPISLKCQRIITTSTDDDQIYQTAYHVGGVFHREDDPALILHKHIEGKLIVCTEIYVINAERHRIDGPAVVQYKFTKGKNRLSAEHYYLNNKRHRDDGPSNIKYNWNNQLLSLDFINSLNM